jgi:hypothetical protein
MMVGVRAMAKDRAKKAARPPVQERPEEPDDGVRKADRKVMNAFLGDVDSSLWGVSAKDRGTALKELREHILEKYRPYHTEHAMDMAISSVGSPEVLAKGIRTLYGYSTGFKTFLVVIIFVFGLATIPMADSWSVVGPWPILGLLGTFFLISSFGPQVGLRWGGLMGLSAASSRMVLVLVLVIGLPEDYTLGTGQSLFDFILVSMFLILVGLLAGHIREISVKNYLQEEIL